MSTEVYLQRVTPEGAFLVSMIDGRLRRQAAAGVPGVEEINGIVTHYFRETVQSRNTEVARCQS
jgi:hypothetical protein